MKKSIKRLLLAGISTLLFVSTFLAVIPQTQTIVYAAGTGNNLQLGHAVIGENANKAVAAEVYFGSKGDPIAWRVIGYNGAGVASSEDTATLLASDNIGTSPFSYTSNEYAGSILQAAVDAICTNSTNRFDSIEDSSILPRTLATGDYSGDDPYTDGVAGTAVVDAKLWPLSSQEANYTYPNLRYTSTNWWLRSPGVGSYAAYVDYGGTFYYDGGYVENEFGVRPALNVDLSSVILTSAAEGGKNSGTVGAGALTEPAGYDGSEGWKLTVLDRSRSFSAVRTDSGKVPAGRNISISYSGATVGENEYVSAILINSSGEVLYYGRIVDKSSGDAAGTANITIPEGLAEGTYTVKVFSEQYHTDKKTDYASDSSDISIEVGKNTPTADDFAVTLPTNTVYDGKAKTATAKTVSGVEGMGTVTVNYYKDGTKLAGAPTDPGTYTVKLDVAEGDNYSAAADITKSDWTFTIQALYSVKAENDGHGTAEADPVSAMAGTTINLKAIASTGYEFKNWTSSDGVEFANATSATTTFKMPAKNVTVKANFEPTGKDISKATISGIKNKTYTGKALKQSPVVKLDGKTLKVDIDYTLSYKNNKNAGTAKVTITGKGDYTGSVTKSFKIKQAANKLNVKAKKDTYSASYSKNKNKSISGTKIYKFTNKKKTKGTIKYTLSSVKKDGKKVSKGFSVSKSNGKLTIKKGVAKGTYKITVEVTAGNKNYKTVTKDVKFNLTIK
ncbi:MAG: DUF6273 domain-containing protein [Lachnospiraceae bacterium]|nr:DUF6273 domain-containing protein [Lachnospiraceae bacterium]